MLSGHSSLQGDGNNSRQLSNRRWVVLLDPHESPQNVIAVARPSVNVRVLKPVGNVTFFSSGKHNWNEPEILASILDEFILELFMYVDGVEGPLVVLQDNRRGCHCLIVLWTDDDDDQVLFLTEVPLHEVYLAYTPELLLKNINMRIKAVVSQQSNEFDDLVDMLVVVRFICDKDPPLLQRERCAVRRVLLFSWSVVADLCVSSSRKSAFTWIVGAVSWVALGPGGVVGHRPPVEAVRRPLCTAGRSLGRA